MYIFNLLKPNPTEKTLNTVGHSPQPLLAATVTTQLHSYFLKINTKIHPPCEKTVKQEEREAAVALSMAYIGSFEFYCFTDINTESAGL